MYHHVVVVWYDDKVIVKYYMLKMLTFVDAFVATPTWHRRGNSVQQGIVYRICRASQAR
jgi:hypothetical protein